MPNKAPAKFTTSQKIGIALLTTVSLIGAAIAIAGFTVGLSFLAPFVL